MLGVSISEMATSRSRELLVLQPMPTKYDARDQQEFAKLQPLPQTNRR
jgi:hypothetical protein